MAATVLARRIVLRPLICETSGNKVAYIREDIFPRSGGQVETEERAALPGMPFLSS